MEITLKAILARFNGNALAAVLYCNGIADTATSPYVRREYNQLGQRLWLDARKKEMTAHA
jgi:hypothetical protein